jgi:hypothetical protein
MSQENVEAFKRFADANNRRDVDALLKELDTDVEWHSAVLRSPARSTRSGPSASAALRDKR